MTPPAARQMRARMIRRRLIAGAVSLFLAMWLLIGVVLVSGHDPALAARTRSVATASAPATATTASTPTTTVTASSPATTTTTTAAATPSTSSSGATSSVTTRQS